MSEQLGFADVEYTRKKRLMCRERFLNEMEKAVPWSDLLAVIEPTPTTGRPGRQSITLSSMFRVHCVQQWFNFSDRQMEDAIYEIRQYSPIRWLWQCT